MYILQNGDISLDPAVLQVQHTVTTHLHEVKTSSSGKVWKPYQHRGRIYTHFRVSAVETHPPTPPSGIPLAPEPVAPAGLGRAGRGAPGVSAKVVQVQAPLPFPTRSFTFGRDRAVPAPASCIPHPASRPIPTQLAPPLRTRFLPIPRVLFPSALRLSPTSTRGSRCHL